MGVPGGADGGLDGGDESEGFEVVEVFLDCGGGEGAVQGDVVGIETANGGGFVVADEFLQGVQNGGLSGGEWGAGVHRGRWRVRQKDGR